MNKKQIIVVEPNSLSTEDKEKLENAGMLVIEHEKPENVRIIEPLTDVQGNHLLMAAMSALKDEYDPKKAFTKTLAERLLSEDSKSSKK